MKLIILSLLFLFSASSMAASLNVTVLEKGTGDPVADATVVIKNTGDYSNTSEKGRVAFDDIKLPVDIKILNSGYETLEKKISKTKVTVYLEPLSVEGDTIEVVEDRIKEKTSKISMNQHELRHVPGTQGDPIKMIESLPGVVQANSGGAGGNPNAIYVRGSSGGENLFWVNRIPIDYLYHTWGISVINPTLVDDFNIFLGGFPVEYNDVLGGVVDIKLRNPKTDRLHQTYRIALNEAAAEVEGPINDKQSFYVAARASYIDKLLGPFIKKISSALSKNGRDISIITLPKYWDAQANWHYRLPKGTMDLYYFGSNDGLAVDINKLATADPDLIGKLAVDFGYHSFGFHAQQNILPKLTGQVTSSYKIGHTFFTRGADANGKPFGYDINQTEIRLQPQLTYRLNNSQEITVGGQALYGYYPFSAYSSLLPTEENFSRGSFTNKKKYQLASSLRWVSASPYAKWRWQWKKFTTQLGVRYSKIRGSGGINMQGFSPRARLEYQATKKLLLYGVWGKYIQPPNPTQLVNGLGNPYLGYTEAEHRILGAQYKIGPLWSVKLEGYHKPMSNLVLTQPTQNPPDTYTNGGKGEAYGMDLFIKRDYGNRKMGWLSYSYARSFRTLINGGGRDFSGDQPHTLTLVWSQPFTGSWNKWTWGIKLQAASGRPYTPVVGRVAMCNNNGQTQVCPDQQNADKDPNLSYWNPIYGARNILRGPLYHRLDVRFDRLIRYDTWTLRVYLDMLNVTMQEAGVNFNYGKNYVNYNHPTKSGLPAIILPFLGVEADF